MTPLISIFTKPLAIAIASMIALQVVRTSFGFHLRECMGSCFPPPMVEPLLMDISVTYTVPGRNPTQDPIGFNRILSKIL